MYRHYKGETSAADAIAIPSQTLGANAATTKNFFKSLFP
jgi:hypothetical protein